jgi:hypothetical protein
MIKALSLQPSLNTPDETKRLEAARAAMADWKAFSHACQARHNAHRLRLGQQSWLRESEQSVEWIFCLTAARVLVANQEQG